MKKTTLMGLVMAMGTCCTLAQAQVKIAEIYTGGGFAVSGSLPASTWEYDYAILFNPTNASVDMSNWQLAYASASGTTWSNRIVFPAGTTIAANGFFFVRLNSTTVAGGSPFPFTPDLTGTSGGGGGSNGINLSTAGGKLALRTNNVTITSGTVCVATDAATSDFIGYGTANCFEGAGASANPAPAGVNALARAQNGCQDNNNNQTDFAVIALSTSTAPRFSGSPTQTCLPFSDCNNNGIDDATEINPSTDCNNNNLLDTCEIAANPTLDFNTNGTLDTCDIAANPSLDCDGNGFLDTFDFDQYRLTDVNANGTPDVCEGARVVEVATNATVRPLLATGGAVRPLDNGAVFFNVSGTNAGTSASFGALRWSASSLLPSAGTVGDVYLVFAQTNAAFTAGAFFPTDPANIRASFTQNDAADITPPSGTNQNNNVSFDNLGVDFADRQNLADYTFVQGSNPSVAGFGAAAGGGTLDVIKIVDAASPSAGASALVADIVSNTGSVTLIVEPITGEIVGATFVGNANTNVRASNAGPRLVVFPGGAAPGCDSVDFNNDGVFPDDGDLADFIFVLGGGTCATCNDVDFNNDGVFPDDSDLETFLFVLGGGSC